MSEKTLAIILVGSESSDFLRISVLSCTRQRSWFSFQVSIRCSPFSGKLTAGFLAGELNWFGRKIERLHRELTGKAELQPLQPNLTITMVGNGRGKIDVVGSARE